MGAAPTFGLAAYFPGYIPHKFGDDNVNTFLNL